MKTNILNTANTSTQLLDLLKKKQQENTIQISLLCKENEKLKVAIHVLSTDITPILKEISRRKYKEGKIKSTNNSNRPLTLYEERFYNRVLASIKVVPLLTIKELAVRIHQQYKDEYRNNSIDTMRLMVGRALKLALKEGKVITVPCKSWSGKGKKPHCYTTTKS